MFSFLFQTEFSQRTNFAGIILAFIFVFLFLIRSLLLTIDFMLSFPRFHCYSSTNAEILNSLHYLISMLPILELEWGF